MGTVWHYAQESIILRVGVGRETDGIRYEVCIFFVGFRGTYRGTRVTSTTAVVVPEVLFLLYILKELCTSL